MSGTTAIVGGGVLGLELARRLALSGWRVTVYEAAPGFGDSPTPGNSAP